MVSEPCVACRIMTLGLETTKEKISTTSTLVYSSRKTFLIFSFSTPFVDELHQRSREERTTHDHDLGV